MNAAVALRRSRRRAGLTQRELAARTGVAQPTIARIERGTEEPRVGTLDRLLNACGRRLEVVENAGIGVDRTGMHGLLDLSHAERARHAVAGAKVLEQLAQARERRAAG